MLKQTHIWGINDWVVSQALDGFAGEDWRARPSGSNSALWLVGHLVMERRATARVLGGDFPALERDAFFGAGTKPDDIPPDLDPAEVLADFRATHQAFVGFLEAMPDEDLQTPIEIEFPNTPKTRLGALQFMLMHESYHVGQLGALRVMLGKGSWMPGA